MKSCAVLRLPITASLALAALSCQGYANGSFQRADDASADASPIPDAAASASDVPATPTEPYDAESVEPNPPDATPPPMPTMDASEPTQITDAGAARDVDAGPPPDLRLVSSPRFEGYLADSAGEPLYMFVGDVPGSKETACLAACA